MEILRILYLNRQPADDHLHTDDYSNSGALKDPNLNSDTAGHGDKIAAAKRDRTYFKHPKQSAIFNSSYNFHFHQKSSDHPDFNTIHHTNKGFCNYINSNINQGGRGQQIGDPELYRNS